MKPQVDVLMAVYNGQKYIEPQIESILNQTHQNLKLIVRDDASRDGSPGILSGWQEKHGQRMRVLYAKKNGGIVSNFSALMEESKAPYIMFADQDDVWKVDKTAKTLAKIQELEKIYSPDVPLLVHTDLRVVDDELREISPSYWKYSNLFPAKTSTLGRQLAQNTITGCTVMINRALVELAKPLPEGQLVMHDWWLGLVASAFGNIGTVSEQTILYRQHENNEVGALEFSLKSFCLRQAHKGALRELCKKQAKAFLSTYGSKLCSEKKAIIAAYLRMQESWMTFERGYLMFKYGLFKQGLLRNLNQLLLG